MAEDEESEEEAEPAVELGAVIDEIEIPYFETRQEFESAVRDVIGTDPIPTADE